MKIVRSSSNLSSQYTIRWGMFNLTSSNLNRLLNWMVLFSTMKCCKRWHHRTTMLPSTTALAVSEYISCFFFVRFFFLFSINCQNVLLEIMGIIFFSVLLQFMHHCKSNRKHFRLNSKLFQSINWLMSIRTLRWNWKMLRLRFCKMKSSKMMWAHRHPVTLKLRMNCPLFKASKTASMIITAVSVSTI